MLIYKRFYILYFVLISVILFLLFLVFFGFKIDLSFIGIENNKKLKSTVVIARIEGNNIYYKQKGKLKKTLSFYDEIIKDVSIETGNDSYVGFYIRDQGYYFLYPNSSLYIEELENFLLKKYQKRSFFILEKGLLYMDLNLFSKNSYIVLKSDEGYFKISKSKLILDKTNNFETKAFCLEGNVNFRPFSQKFEFYENKKAYNISSSIERLLNTGNLLTKNQYSTIDMESQKKLDAVLTKIYESKNAKIINKDYIKNSISIPTYSIENINFHLPDFDIVNFNLNCGFIEFSTLSSGSFYLNNIRLDKNKRYLFNQNNNIMQLINDLYFTKIIYNINLNEREHKSIKLKEINGIKNINLNNKKVDYSVNYEKLDLTVKNYLLCDIKKVNDFVRSINLSTDVEILKILFLFKRERVINNFFKIDDIVIENNKYFMYDYGFDDNMNIYIPVGQEFVDEEIKILLFFNDINYFNI